MKYELSTQDVIDIVVSLQSTADFHHKAGMCPVEGRTLREDIALRHETLAKRLTQPPHEETTERNCRICAGPGPVRHVALYLFGSEGVEICHDCEMSFLEVLKAMIGTASRSQKVGYLAAKKVHAAKELRQTPGLDFDSVKPADIIAQVAREVTEIQQDHSKPGAWVERDVDHFSIHHMIRRPFY